jgi:alpha-mannosidase
LFEPTGEERKTGVSVPCLHLSFEVKLQGFEIKTMAVDLDSKEIFEVDLMEKRL